MDSYDHMLYNNEFIKKPTNPSESKKIKSYIENQADANVEEEQYKDPYLESDLLKVNRVIDEKGNLRDLNKHRITKEERVVLSINSNQRNFFKNSDLTTPAEYIDYIQKDSYEKFAELYKLARSLGKSSKSYQERTFDSTSTMASTESQCRSIVDSLVKQRACDPSTDVSDINGSLVDLLTTVATVVSGKTDPHTLAATLNAYVMAGAAHNPDKYWRPFYFTRSSSSDKPIIRQVLYDYQRPDHYTVTLPSIINHVKSIKLLSTSIPLTINNINERNNIITLQLRRKGVEGINDGDPVPVQLDATKSVFNFILILLDVGIYTVSALASHLELKLNESVSELTCKKYNNVFSVTFNNRTGQIVIACLRPDLEFHMKFYSELVGSVMLKNSDGDDIGKSRGNVSNFARDLWYLLGFPWPYEVAEDGSDKYTSLLTNYVNYGIHEVFSPKHPGNDIFDRDKVDVKASMQNIYDNKLYLEGPDNKHNVINSYRIFRYPQIDIKYIYLILKGLKAISHVNQFNGVIDFDDNDFFAKILLDGTPGELMYNSFMQSPLIFANVIDKLENLEINWVDETGATVDFNKADHSFTLEVVHYVTQIDTNAYNTKLGNIDPNTLTQFYTT